LNIVMLLYPRLTQLDLTGPFEVFARFGECEISLVWKVLEPVVDGNGLRLLPTHTFADAPQADVLFVPGGPGQIAIMEDEATLSFLRTQAAGAQYVTSVCTGSLILAAAGLLSGYRATCHWLSLEQLAYFDVTPVSERVVEDRSRVTGGGVTSGIDFALTLCARLFGDERTKRVQLSMEYDPQPPFASGSPTTVESDVVADVLASTREFQVERESVARRAAARIGRNGRVPEPIPAPQFQ
jgi:cyclohexyl-isocyanide hydratase